MLARRWIPAALCTVALLAAAAPAQAFIPTGNLLTNPGVESGSFVVDETNHLCPQSWTCDATYPNLTGIAYGTTIFPSIAEGNRIGGGKNFISGGPNNSLAKATQFIQLGVQPEFTGGQVKATFSGCLGGFADQDDYVSLDITFYKVASPGGTDIGYYWSQNGPKAVERGGQTKLLPVSRTVTVEPGTQSFRFGINALRVSGGTYNDGYADNLSVTFGPVSGPDPPAASCSAPTGGGGGGGGTGGGGGGQGGAKSPKSVLSFGSARVGSNGTARMRITCNTTQVSRCKGTLSASLVRASSSASKRGSVSFSIPSLKSRTIKVKLRKSDVRKIRSLSKSKLKKRRLKLRATTTVGTQKVTQTSRLRVKRSG